MRLQEVILDSNPDSDHVPHPTYLAHVDYDPNKTDLGLGARVNVPIYYYYI